MPRHDFPVKHLGLVARQVEIRKKELYPCNALFEIAEFRPGLPGKSIDGMPALVAQQESAAGRNSETALRCR